jgi:hypothetical protein
MTAAGKVTPGISRRHGRVLEELFEPAFIARNPVQVGVSEALDEGKRDQYSAEEAAIVEERLKALGYIE